MKTRLLLLALAPLVFGGCSNTVIVSSSVYTLHTRESAVISVELFEDKKHPPLPSLVHLTSKNPTVASFPASPVVLRPPAGTGTASAVVTAGPVDQDTLVVMHAEWVHPLINDSGETIINVLPPVGTSPTSATVVKSISVSPSVTPSWTFDYVITTAIPSGTRPNLIGCRLVFDKPVILSFVSAANSTVGAITLPAPTATGGGVMSKNWYVGGGATFHTLAVRAVATKVEPGGTVTVTGYETATVSYTATATGPK